MNFNSLIMEGYKVLFQHNRAVTAQHLDHIDYKDLVKLSGQGKKKHLEWLVVTGRDEKDALVSANNMVHNFWADYLQVA